ncbi:MAG: carbonic anhydrase [Planctomycetales bacterium]|nr:carbonic anhydrase [Planctomycetales bacterium]
MQKLVHGIQRFQNQIVQPNQDFFERLAAGQSPMAMFITCSDSRINPNQLTQTEPGDLFVLRNVGNIIPPSGTSNNGEAAAIEFAVEGLGIRDIIVCGHTHCGAMKGLLDMPSIKTMQHVRKWLRHAEATQQIVEENYKNLTAEARLTVATEENVLVQIRHLQAMPPVAAAMGRGEMNIYGWMYKIETGEVFQYDWNEKQFLPLSVLASTTT